MHVQFDGANSQVTAEIYRTTKLQVGTQLDNPKLTA